MHIKNIYSKFKEIGIINTIRLNFHYLKFNQAIKFPILASKNLRIREIKGNIIIEKPHFGCIKLGFDSLGIFDNKNSRSIIEIGDRSKLIFKGSASFGNGFKLSIGGGKLTIGQGFSLTGESTIICNYAIEILDNCLFSWNILIMDTDLHKIFNNNRQYYNSPQKIFIGENVWIGCRVTILKGSYIPNNSIIAACSIITQKILTENCIYGGQPIKILKSNIHWER